MNNLDVLNAIKAAKLPPPEPGRLHLCGVRIGEQGTNRYDDALIVFGTHLDAFRCTVDPGATFTKNPGNPRGCAHLTWGHWRYRLGEHRGRPALVQAVPVIVRRDRDRDGTAEAEEPLEKGWFGINIHRGGASPTIDAWSAGCQVIPTAEAQWDGFWRVIQASGQQEFSYYLLPDNVTSELIPKIRL